MTSHKNTVQLSDVNFKRRFVSRVDLFQQAVWIAAGNLFAHLLHFYIGAYTPPFKFHLPLRIEAHCKQEPDRLHCRYENGASRDIHRYCYLFFDPGCCFKRLPVDHWLPDAWTVFQLHVSSILFYHNVASIPPGCRCTP